MPRYEGAEVQAEDAPVRAMGDGPQFDQADQGDPGQEHKLDATPVEDGVSGEGNSDSYGVIDEYDYGDGDNNHGGEDEDDDEMGFWERFRYLTPLGYAIIGGGLALVVGLIALAFLLLRGGDAKAAEPSGAISNVELSIYEQAFTLAEGGNFIAMEGVIDTLRDRRLVPALRLIQYRSGRSNASLEEIGLFIDQHPDFPGVALAEIGRQSLLKDSVSETQMLAYYDSNPPLNFAAELHQLQLLARNGEQERANATAREFWRTRTLQPGSQRDLLAAFGDHITDADNVTRLRHLMVHGARNSGDRLVPMLPEEWQELATLWVNRVPVRDVPVPYRPHPVFAVPQIIAADQAGETDRAIEILIAIPEALRLPDFEWRSRHIVIRELLKQQRFDEAFEIARNHGLVAPSDGGSDTVAEANWLAGLIAFTRLALPNAAEDLFTEASLSATSVNWKAQTLYWLGKVKDSRLKSDEANRAFRDCAALAHSYYGQLCADELDSKLFAPPLYDRTLPVGSAQGADPAQPPMFREGQNDDMLTIVRGLIQLNRTNDASRFLYALGGLAEDVDDLAILVDLANSGGLSRTALGLSWNAADRGLPELGGMLPTLDAQLLSPVNLEIALLYAIASRESVFVIDAESPKGALGLMQVLPETAREQAGKLGLEYDEARMTTDASYNLTIGASYLDGLLQAFDGNLLLAIAAYNAGPANVERWVRDFGDPGTTGVDSTIWIESIPFRETRNYVKDVTARYNLYRALLTGQSVRVYTPNYLAAR